MTIIEANHAPRRSIRSSTRSAAIVKRAWAIVSIAGIAMGNAHAADPSPLPATIDRIRHAIVAIGTTEATRNPSFQFRGTGFAVGDGSLIATNNHVLPPALDPAARETLAIAIPLPGGEATIREATTVARDVEHDVALLRVGGPPLPAMGIGDSTRVHEGQAYAFTGFPIGAVIGLFPTTHHALISAITPAALTQPTARTLDPALIRKLRSDQFAIFQLDATAYPGNSGSPMYDPETGDVIAIVNSGLVKAGKESALSQPTGISYAVPTAYLARLLESVKREAP